MKLSVENMLLCVGVLLIPFDAVFNAGPARVTIAELAISLAMLLWLIRSVLQRRVPILPPYLLPMAVFLAACVLSAVYAEEKIVVVRETIQFLWMFCLSLYIFDQCARKELFTGASRLFIVSGLIVSIVGVYQHFAVRLPVDFLISEARLRAHGFYAQPNTLGSFLGGIIPLVLGSYLIFRVHDTRGVDSRPGFRTTPRLLLGVLFILLLAFTMTFSRGSWAALAIGMICFAALIRSYIRPALLVLPSLCALAACIVVWVSMAGQNGAIDRSFSNRQRLSLAESAIAMFRDHPLTGVGSGNFQYRLSQYSTVELDSLLHRNYSIADKRWYYDAGKPAETELAHNALLQVGAEMGCIGILAFVWLFGAVLLCAWHQWRRSGTETERLIRASALTSVIVLLAGGMFGWPFSHGVQEVLMATMAIAASPRP